MTRDQAIALMVRIEGGEANLVGDPGGHTKYGITQRTLNSFQHLPTLATIPTPANVADLVPVQAAWIYRTVQWAIIRGDDLPTPLACLMLNAAVNMGEPTAIRLLYDCLGITSGTIVGPVTLAAIPAWRSRYMPEQTLAEEFAARCAVRYAKLDGREDQFELGWFRRLFRVYTLAVCS